MFLCMLSLEQLLSGLFEGLRLARDLQKEGIYKCDEVREVVSLVVVLMLHHVWEIYVKISAAQDMTRRAPESAFGRQPWSYFFLAASSNFQGTKIENHSQLKSRLSQQTQDLGRNSFWPKHLIIGWDQNDESVTSLNVSFHPLRKEWLKY